MLPKSVNSARAEVLEIISDTRFRIKKEFSSDGGKRTSRIREKLVEHAKTGDGGLEFQILPYVNQEEMYGHVYRTLKEGGCIGIFPEGG